MIDVRECRRELERHVAAKRETNRSLWCEAREDAHRAVEYIVRTYHPRKVIQWGSVLHPERFGPRSDIDIAVEGDFDAATWFRLVGDVGRMTRFPLDVVDFRRLEPEFADIITMKGRVVYDRDSGSD